MKPVVSVGIPCYNRADELQRTLESLVNQTYETIEIIISDNCSPDPDVERIGHAFMTQDPRIRYVRQESNKGMAFNFTFVLEQATGEYFMWLSDDDWLSRSYIQCCVEELIAHPDLAVVGGQALYFKNDRFDHRDVAMNIADDDEKARILTFFQQAGDIGIFYGVMRRKQLHEQFLTRQDPNSLCNDWLLIAQMACLGKLKTLDSVYIYKDMRDIPPQTYLRSIAREVDLSAWHVRHPYLSIGLSIFTDITIQSPIYRQFSLLQRLMLGFQSAFIIIKRYYGISFSLFRFTLKKIVQWLLSPPQIHRLGELLFRAMGRRSPSIPCELSQSQRILVVRLDDISGIIHTIPLLRELRDSFPKAQITVLAQPEALNILELCPYINDVLALSTEFHVEQKGGKALFMQYWRIMLCAYQQLWKRHFDLALIPIHDIDWYQATVVAYLSGAIYRIGYSEQSTPGKTYQNHRYDVFLSHVLAEHHRKHDLEYGLNMLHSLKGTIAQTQLECWLRDEDTAFADRLWDAHAIQPHERIVVISPGPPPYPTRWTTTHFVQLQIWLAEEFAFRTLLIGNPGEEAIAEQFGNTTINAIGVSFRQTVALLKKCSVFIGNETHFTYLAAVAAMPAIAVIRPFLNNSMAFFTYQEDPWTPGKFLIIEPKKPASLEEQDDETIDYISHTISLEHVKVELRCLLEDGK